MYNLWLQEVDDALACLVQQLPKKQPSYYVQKKINQIAPKNTQIKKWLSFQEDTPIETETSKCVPAVKLRNFA